MTSSEFPPPPAPDELEVSLFGSGYGEALALHVGGGSWILVDSCPGETGVDSASLNYLSSIGVDPAQGVRLVVVTHWHDDHIKGISSIVDQCGSAQLVISVALRNDEFSTLASVYGRQVIPDGSGISEMVRVLESLNARRNGRSRFIPPRFAMANTRLYREEIALNGGSVPVRIYALSPSDAAILQAKVAFSQLFPSGGRPMVPIAAPSQNLSSVVLWVAIGTNRVLLGADLEVVSDPHHGWTAILDSSTVLDGTAEVFKVPHHGSSTAHEDRVWKEVLVPDPYGILTPFVRGRSIIPTSSDVRWMLSFTDNLFATGLPTRRRWRPRERIVREMVEKSTRSIEELSLGWGHIVMRKSLSQAGSDWQIQLRGDATKLI